MTKQIINGVEVIEDGDVTHFKPIEPVKETKPKEPEKSWWQSLLEVVTPYFKVRDLRDPLEKGVGPDAGNKQTGVEVGIKVSF